MDPYKQVATTKPIAGFCASIVPRIPSRLERTASSNIVINKAMTARKSTSFHGFSDNMVSGYTGSDFVTKEKVVVSFLLVAGCHLQVVDSLVVAGGWLRGVSRLRAT